MDDYYSDYFKGFAPGRPYVSLIAAEVGGELAVSGRVFWMGSWLQVTRIAVERTPLVGVGRRSSAGGPKAGRERVARLASAFGDQAEARLRRAGVAVIGAGGTGSTAIELLAGPASGASSSSTPMTSPSLI